MVIPEAVDLVGLYAHFWGHSVLEFAPKLLMFDADEACPRDAPMLVDAHAPPSHVALLRALCEGRRPVIPVTMDRSVLAERLWVAPTITFVPPWPAPGQRFDAAWSGISPVAAAAILARAPALRPAPSGPRRLFLARRESLHRKLVNQAQIIERFERAGFAVVYPEEHAVEVQVQLMQEATHIAGPGGSNLMLPLFLGNPRMALLVLCFPDFEELPTLTAVAEARGMRVRVATGPVEPGNARRPGDADYLIPIEVIDQALGELGL
jgi:capsular polysaccharide biosynthesis protein